MSSGVSFADDDTTMTTVVNSSDTWDVSDGGSTMMHPAYNGTEVREWCKHQENSSELVRLPVCSSDTETVQRSVLAYAFVVCISFIMFAMGCKVRLKKLWMRFKAPYGISVGFVCQFGIMPLCAFGLAKMLSLPRAQALVVLITGCLPGGSASNLVCYWCDADIDLSIAMTSISTVLAFAMIPLNLFLYSREWSTEAVAVPFLKISIVLAIFIVPVSLGAMLNYFCPKVAKLMAKVGAVLGVIIVIVTSALGIVLYPEALNIPTAFWIAGAILPIVGYILGFILSMLLGFLTKSPQLEMPQVRTIAIETGLQNVQMCSTIVQLNYKCTCLILDMFSYPLVYFVCQIGEAVLLCAGYKIFKLFCRSSLQDVPNDASESTVHQNNYIDADAPMLSRPDQADAFRAEPALALNEITASGRPGDSEDAFQVNTTGNSSSGEIRSRDHIRTFEGNNVLYDVTEDQTRL